MATLYKWTGGPEQSELIIQDGISLELKRVTTSPKKEYTGWMTWTLGHIRKTIWQPAKFKANGIEEAQETLLQMAIEHAIKQLCNANQLLANLLNANATQYAAQTIHNQKAIETMREVNQAYISLAEAAPARPGDEIET